MHPKESPLTASTPNLQSSPEMDTSCNFPIATHVQKSLFSKAQTKTSLHHPLKRCLYKDSVRFFPQLLIRHWGPPRVASRSLAAEVHQARYERPEFWKAKMDNKCNRYKPLISKKQQHMYRISVMKYDFSCWRLYKHFSDQNEAFHSWTFRGSLS